jgi:hypothetical protein
MFAPSYRPAGKPKDDCWICSAPVYAGDAAVRYLGLWMHESCFSDANLSGDAQQGEPGEDAAAA